MMTFTHTCSQWSQWNLTDHVRILESYNISSWRGPIRKGSILLFKQASKLFCALDALQKSWLAAASPKVCAFSTGSVLCLSVLNDSNKYIKKLNQYYSQNKAHIRILVTFAKTKMCQHFWMKILLFVNLNQQVCLPLLAVKVRISSKHKANIREMS